MRVQPHRFGVNRDGRAQINGFRQIVTVNMNGHDVTLTPDFYPIHIPIPYLCRTCVTSSCSKPAKAKKSDGLKKRNKKTIRLANV